MSLQSTEAERLDRNSPHYEAYPETPPRMITLTSFDGRTKHVTEGEYRKAHKQIFGDMPLRLPDDSEPEREPSKKRYKGPYSQKQPIPEELRWEVFERDDFRCKKCGHRRMLRADHIIPESKGGKATLDNLQTLCMPCNSRKGPRLEVAA